MKRIYPFLIALCVVLAPRAARAQTYDVIHNFSGADGSDPRGRLLSVGSDLYGTTLGGGASDSCSAGCGTVFRMDAAGNVTTLHSFDIATEGSQPGAGIVLGTDGDFYGTTITGGSVGNDGAIYRMSADGQVTTLHDFDRDTGGWFPTTPLFQAADGNLYGTTLYGHCDDDSNNCAVLYRTTLGGGFTVIHTFGSTEGTSMEAPVMQANNGDLYGTTSLGGGGNSGTIFHVSAGIVTTLHAFSGDDGGFPMGALIQASDGKIYGTTAEGGTSNMGTIFRIDLNGNFSSLHSFDGSDGRRPQAGLLAASDGSFYGTTDFGGASGVGTLFRMDTNGVVVTLHDFEGSPVVKRPAGLPSPTGELVETADGRIYGVHTNGGTSGLGFVFHLTPAPPPLFCPDAFVRRDQMAVFLLKTEHGSAFVPPACAGLFPDVSCPGLFADWIEQLAGEGITTGCGSGHYCPISPITRGQMAVFLLKTEHGPSFTPPACTGVFPDVPCGSQFADWIETLAGEGITSGCGNGNFCPGNPVTRAQMAVFLLKVEHGSSFVPPNCTPTFADVVCPSLFAAWIEQLFDEQITAGCAGS